MQPILEVKNLSKKYNDKNVITDINMKIYKGDIYGFIGPNGAGKTTTIKTILGLLKSSSGEVLIEGVNSINNAKVISSKIGAMIDYPSFYQYLTGFKNLSLYANILNLDKKRIDEVLDMVNLSRDKNKKVGAYSMGMKQRLAVARAFLNNPEIVILDEPTNGLDPEGVIEMRKLIKDLAGLKRTTFMYCSHILNEVQNLCNRVAMISNGKIIFQNSINSLLDNGRESYDIITTDKNSIRKVLESKVLNIIETDEGICIEINSGDFKLINDLIVKSNIAILSISKKNYSLEDYFIKCSKKIL
ncbi:ABC transporter ATP-binding protein [Clostridium cibarium]|uniref:ATP-binding cassette domain-containing protein n=1 Tax=Clostridium cibarium TaxID=2762247 RepID=A0ABR8PR74_9CLOT|nr:ATP-binding cassette domain-containing protein [Clostridium cibarium]MBD7910679.1 ATP-binding cassette domain-containing protein [Clostridium cibarium]